MGTNPRDKKNKADKNPQNEDVLAGASPFIPGSRLEWDFADEAMPAGQANKPEETLETPVVSKPVKTESAVVRDPVKNGSSGKSLADSLSVLQIELHAARERKKAEEDAARDLQNLQNELVLRRATQREVVRREKDNRTPTTNGNKQTPTHSTSGRSEPTVSVGIEDAKFYNHLIFLQSLNKNFLGEKIEKLSENPIVINKIASICNIIFMSVEFDDYCRKNVKIRNPIDLLNLKDDIIKEVIAFVINPKKYRRNRVLDPKGVIHNFILSANKRYEASNCEDALDALAADFASSEQSSARGTAAVNSDVTSEAGFATTAVIARPSAAGFATTAVIVPTPARVATTAVVAKPSKERATAEVIATPLMQAAKKLAVSYRGTHDGHGSASNSSTAGEGSRASNSTKVAPN